MLILLDLDFDANDLVNPFLSLSRALILQTPPPPPHF